MSDVTVYGPAFSSYVRTVRMTLEEKGVDYNLEAADRSSEEYLTEHHPFGKVPAFEHDDFCLYETAAICRYVDEAFEGPGLQPGGAREHARMQQVISISNSYLYPAAVLGILIPRILVPLRGGETDEEKVAASVEPTRRAMGALEALLGDHEFFTGPELSLADLFVLPIAEGMTMVPERDAAFEVAPRLGAWLQRMSERPSAILTRPEL